MSNINQSIHKGHNDQGDFIKSQISKYLRYWYWFALSLIIALSAAYLNLRYTPKIFSTSAKIKILNKSKGLELPSSAFVFNRNNINLENEIEIIKSYRIIEKVVDTLDLTMRYFEEGNVLTTEVNQLPFNILKTVSNDSIYSTSSYWIEVTEQGFEVTLPNTEEIIEFPDFDTTKKAHNLPFELSLDNHSKVAELIDKVYLVRFSPIHTITKGLKNAVKINMLGQNNRE